MGEENSKGDAGPNAQDHPGESKGSLILFIAGGLGLYALLYTLDPAIAYPLRKISSTIATFLLNALSVPSTLTGTVVSTTDFTFDVNPDCSGSTSLRIMLTLGALWFGMYPNLTLGRRLICLALAAPIAVFFNAVRVTALVIMGDARGHPVEGFPHELVGIVSFGLAMGAVYIMTLLMAQEPSLQKRSGPRAHLAFLLLALGICFAPVLWGAYLFAASRLVSIVHLGFVLTSLGLLFFTAWGKAPGPAVTPWIPCATLGFSLFVMVAGTVTSVSTLSSLSLIGALIAVLLYTRGSRFTLNSLPLLGVLYLGLSGLHYFVIMKLVRRVVSEENRHNGAALVEVIIAAALIGIFFYLTLKERTDDGKDSRPRKGALAKRLTAVPMKVLILGAFLGIIFQTYFNSQAAAFDENYVVTVPLSLGDWQGVREVPNAIEVEAYGEEGVIRHNYHREGWDSVTLLVSSSSGRRYTGHNPRNCMANLGWRVLEEEEIAFAGAGRTVPMVKLLMGRGEERIEMRYWIESDRGDVVLTTRELYFTDVGMRLTGRRPNWSVYRVYGRPESKSMDDFLRGFTR